MKGLWKYLTPFAPDQSGAVSVLYEMGGIMVICDAGGCAGNICGFDEPRWCLSKSAIFSAGLRDMDAILGRDDKLAAKLSDAAAKLDASFIALIGTPVPAVIGTDYKALSRMVEKQTHMKVFGVDANGCDLFDKGEEKAWLSLFQTFAKKESQVKPGRIGVIGATPLSVSDLAYDKHAGAVLEKKDASFEYIFYGIGFGLESVALAGSCERNLVVSPSGIKSAEWLLKEFGTPFEICDPAAKSFIEGLSVDFTGKKVLVCEQQVRALAIKEALLARGAKEVVLSTWFMTDNSLPSVIRLREEDDYTELVKEQGFDLIMGDPSLFKLVPDFTGEKLALNSFALSGRLIDQ